MTEIILHDRDVPVVLRALRLRENTLQKVEDPAEEEHLELTRIRNIVESIQDQQLSK